jgi:hypothetical protein
MPLLLLLCYPLVIMAFLNLVNITPAQLTAGLNGNCKAKNEHVSLR